MSIWDQSICPTGGLSFFLKFTISGKQVIKSSGFSYEDRENKQVLEVFKLSIVRSHSYFFFSSLLPSTLVYISYSNLF